MTTTRYYLICLLFCFQQMPVFSQHSRIPFDNSNPVVYDNDDHRDMYTDEYLLSLASAGTIRLKAIITTYSADSIEYNLFVRGRQEIIDKARRSGLVHLPDATAGPSVALIMPSSKRIEDTKPLESKAGKIIVAEALRTTVSKPLVIITGGQLTAVADAYLQDTSIAGRVIVCGIFGALDLTYNAGLDRWAWVIVISKFKCLSISDSDSLYNHIFRSARPQTPKARFAADIQSGKLPGTELYQWMLEKHHPRHPSTYMETDGDGAAALALTRPDYITGIERWRCTGLDEKGFPVLVRDKAGPLYLAIEAAGAVGTEAFWKGFENAGVRER